VEGACPSVTRGHCYLRAVGDEERRVDVEDEQRRMTEVIPTTVIGRSFPVRRVSSNAAVAPTPLAVRSVQQLDRSRT